jgi:Na+-transporting methylmalonyl-CoA/oxaloacetate decarboxylase gamma subunit
MSLSVSILTALFCIVVVFAVLGILWAIIRLFSAFIRVVEKRNEEKSYSGSNPND